MEQFTPCGKSFFTASTDPCVSPEAMSTNLFKDVPIPAPPDEKLQAFLRIRPVDGLTAERRPFLVSQNNLITLPPDRSKAFKNVKDGSSGSRQYTFNHIFDEDVGQEAFYERCALPLTVRLLRGESSLLFAYGTTNSGKSFTMRGTSSQPGVIPRALNTLFTCVDGRIDKDPAFRCLKFAEAEPLTPEEAELERGVSRFICSESKKRQPILTSFRNLSLSRDSTLELLEESSLNHPANSDIRFTAYVSFVEFYMDTINDLLAVEVDSKKNQQLLLIQDLANNYFVRGLRRVAVASADEAFCALLYGWDNLHRAETSLNKDSSRSHCVFTVTLIGYESGQYGRLRQVSNLSFCDLAGSERGDRTQNTGYRLKEAGKINNSLSTLGRCISALRQNQRKKSKLVVPFRDSSLTKYFQSYFNGTGVASMVININPSVDYFDETLVTLQFSAEASDVTVMTEETRLKFKESFARLTQQWIQSSQRWSSFSKLKPDNRLTSTLLCPESSNDCIEEVEEEDEAELTAEDLETLQNSLLQTDDPETLTSLIERIELLSEKLKASENDKFNMEVEIRREVNKEIRNMEMEHAAARAEDRAARRELEQKLRDQVRDLKQKHRSELQVKDEKICQQQKELNAMCEEVNRMKAEMKQQVSVAQSELQEAKAQTECLMQQLHALVTNTGIPDDDAPDILKLVYTKIRDEQTALHACKESNEKVVLVLQQEVSRLNAEATKRQEIKSASRRDQSCATSPTSVRDALCSPRTPVSCTQDKCTSTDGVIQCQDQSVQTNTAVECQSMPVRKMSSVSVYKATAAAAAAPVAVSAQVNQKQCPKVATSGEDDDEADVSMEIGVTKKRKLQNDAYLQAIRLKEENETTAKQRRMEKEKAANESTGDECSTIDFLDSKKVANKSKKTSNQSQSRSSRRVPVEGSVRKQHPIPVNVNDCFSVSPCSQEDDSSSMRSTRKLRNRRIVATENINTKRLFSSKK